MVCSDYLDIMEWGISWFFGYLNRKQVVNARISVNLIIKVMFFFIWYFAISERSTGQYIITFVLWLVFDIQLYLEWNYIHNQKEAQCLIWNHNLKRDVVSKIVDTLQLIVSWFFTYSLITNDDPNYTINILLMVVFSIDFVFNVGELIKEYCTKKSEDRKIVYQATQQTEQQNQQNQNMNQNTNPNQNQNLNPNQNQNLNPNQNPNPNPNPNQNQNQGQIEIQNQSPSQEISADEGAQIFYLGIILGSAFAFYILIYNLNKSLEIDELELSEEYLFVYGQFNMIAAMIGQIIIDLLAIFLFIAEWGRKFFSTDLTKNVVLALYGLTCGMLNLFISFIIGMIVIAIFLLTCFCAMQKVQDDAKKNQGTT